MRSSLRIASALLALFGGTGLALAQDLSVPMPQPTVPEVFTLQGQFVRLAYNNEGFVTLGYRIANQEAGNEWMLLDVGATVHKGVKDFTLKREAFTVTTPDGTTIPIATQREYAEAGYLKSLNRRAQVTKDSISYFPIMADKPCAMRFFAAPGTIAFDEVGLSYERACVGRLFFHVPGGIQTGQHWLNVQFATSVVQVPFRILTEEEEKELGKKWKEIKKQHEAALNGE